MARRFLKEDKRTKRPTQYQYNQDGNWVDYFKGESTICLDGNFSVEDLKQIIGEIEEINK